MESKLKACLNLTFDELRGVYVLAFKVDEFNRNSIDLSVIRTVSKTINQKEKLDVLVEKFSNERDFDSNVRDLHFKFVTFMKNVDGYLASTNKSYFRDTLVNMCVHLIDYLTHFVNQPEKEVEGEEGVGGIIKELKMTWMDKKDWGIFRKRRSGLSTLLLLFSIFALYVFGTVEDVLKDGFATSFRFYDLASRRDFIDAFAQVDIKINSFEYRTEIYTRDKLKKDSCEDNVLVSSVNHYIRMHYVHFSIKRMEF